MNAEEAFDNLKELLKAKEIMHRVISGNVSYNDLAIIYAAGYNAAKPIYCNK